MNQKLVKRFSFFGRIIIVVFFVSIASWLQKIESYSIQNDLIDLNLIATIKDEPAKYSLRDQSVYRNTIGWLDKNRPELSNMRREARGEILDWLKTVIGYLKLKPRYLFGLSVVCLVVVGLPKVLRVYLGYDELIQPYRRWISLLGVASGVYWFVMVAAGFPKSIKACSDYKCC